MTTTPRLVVTELAASQAIPETTVNEMVRRLEQGANHFLIKDRDLATPPGSPADGDRYIVASSPTGAWTGHTGDIAYYQSSAWVFVDKLEGMTFWLEDENVFLVWDGAAYLTFSPVTEASNAEIYAGDETAKFISPRRLFTAAAPVTLVDGATITPDFDAGINFDVTLAGDRVLANPTNQKVGQSGVIYVEQDATGTRLLTFGAAWRFAGGDPTLSTAAGSVDVIAYHVRSSGFIAATISKALA